MTPAATRAGAISRSNSRRFGPSDVVNRWMPVVLPPGRLKLLTRPSCTGSLPLWKTIGIVEVAACAARATWGPPAVAITATWLRTRSAASAGSRSI